MNLFEACITGHVGELKALIQSGINLNVKIGEGDTPLCIVAKCRPDLVKLFIENGADVNQKSDSNISPLHWAVEYDNTDVVTHLLEAGANTEITDHSGETPLHWAGWTGHHKSAALIIAHGGNIKATNTSGKTPLDLAKMQEHTEMIRLLTK
ncbi:MAG: ankyrin repeat domain-containing protein [Clostridia bacterium]|nr:ankyrin repeat domain-containing protein [Clostridia bacterium]